MAVSLATIETEASIGGILIIIVSEYTGPGTTQLIPAPPGIISTYTSSPSKRPLAVNTVSVSPPGAPPLIYHWKVGLLPPKDGEALNSTTSPGHISTESGLILTEAVMDPGTFITIPSEATGVVPTQPAPTPPAVIST